MNALREVVRILVRSFMNSIVASQIMPMTLRYHLLRLWGMDLHSKKIYPRYTFRSPNVSIGEDTMISWNVFFDTGARITIGKHSGVSVGSFLLTETHEVGGPDCRYGKPISMPVTIGDGVWVGVGVIIQPGVTIGDGCIINAGAVVTKDCEPHGLYGGVPARRLRDLPMD